MRVPIVTAVTAWDARTFARGCAIALATLGIAYVVTAASDEGGIAWGERAGRALPIAPLCAAVGAWLALAPGRARGEDVALAAIGRSPWQRHAAAIAGGAAIAILAALMIAAVPRVDVRGFYPRAEEAIVWRPSATNGFASDDGRWRVWSDGVPTRAPTEGVATSDVARALPRGARAAAALATALAGLALPMLVASARSRRRAALVLAAVAATTLVTVLAFQAAAAARAPALLAPVAPLLLLAVAATRYRSSPWRKARYPR